MKTENEDVNKVVNNWCKQLSNIGEWGGFRMSAMKEEIFKIDFEVKSTLNKRVFNYQKFTMTDYKEFADIFFIGDWKNELEYQLTYYQDRHKTKKPNPKYSNNYGCIMIHTKDWVEYVTFQGSRVILQFNMGKYKLSLRKEKIKRVI